MKEIQRNFEIDIFFRKFKSDDRKTTDTIDFKQVCLKKLVFIFTIFYVRPFGLISDQTRFPVIHKVVNVVNFVLLRSEE